jgi:hypothetical protein
MRYDGTAQVDAMVVWPEGRIAQEKQSYWFRSKMLHTGDEIRPE